MDSDLIAVKDEIPEQFKDVFLFDQFNSMQSILLPSVLKGI
jgi:hypothetical protein